MVLLPTLNEEAAIGKTIRDIQEHIWCNILVVDSSTDETARIAVGLGAEVSVVPKEGKGKAVRDALAHICAPESTVDAVIMMDGDYTYPASHIPRMIDLMELGADVVAGYRRNRERGAISFMNTIGNRALSLLATLYYRYPVKDVCTGMWGFRVPALREMRLTSNGFTLEADLFANAIGNNLRITQIPIGYRARRGGSDSKLKISDGFQIAKFISGGRRFNAMPSRGLE